MRRRWEVDKNAPRKVDGAKHGAATSFVDDPADVVPPAPHYAIVAEPLRPFAHPERVGASAFPPQRVCQLCRISTPSTPFCPTPLHPLEAFSANHARGGGWPEKAEEWLPQQDAVSLKLLSTSQSFRLYLQSNRCGGGRRKNGGKTKRDFRYNDGNRPWHAGDSSTSREQSGPSRPIVT